MRVNASGVDLVRVDFVEVDLVAPNPLKVSLNQKIGERKSEGVWIN